MCCSYSKSVDIGMISDAFKTYYFVKCTFIMVKSARDLQYALNEISVYCIKWKWNVYFEKISFIKAAWIKKNLPSPITSISLYVLLAITNYLFCLHVFRKILYSIFFFYFSLEGQYIRIEKSEIHLKMNIVQRWYLTFFIWKVKGV